MAGGAMNTNHANDAPTGPSPAEAQERPVAQEPESAVEPELLGALEPATLPSHPLRAMDVTCFLPKLIG